MEQRQDQKRRTMTDGLFCSRKVTDARQGKGEERDHFIRRLTHLRLQDMGIATMENLNKTRKLQVLYLNSNVINCMSGLQHKNLKSLLQLDLQDNDITVMEGFECLSGLRRLSLARNCIAYVVGLENCPRLNQLDISGQRLADDTMSVEFDEMSIDAMSETIVSLNASDCGLLHVEHLACLDSLTTLDISNNAVSSVDGFATLLLRTSRRTGRNRQLRTLVTTGNPAMETGGPRVRDTLVMMAESLQCLNGKDIEPRQRNFLMRFEARKTVPKKKVGSHHQKLTGSSSNITPDGGVLVEVGQRRPLAFEDSSAYGKHRMPSGNRAMPGNMISLRSKKPSFR